MESLPAPKHLGDEQFGNYHLEVSEGAGYLLIERSLNIPVLRLEADLYDEMCAFFKLIEAADKAAIVLKANP